jgi:pimeloyl-ACP methyl ester carboxylesterase
VLFLHAFPLDASQWDAQVAALSGDHRCLRPDMWGCGTSAPLADPGGATVDAYAAAVLARLDEAGVGAFTVVGCSMGGYVVWGILRKDPERVRAAILVSTRTTPDTAEQAANRRKMADLALRNGVETAIPMVKRLLGPRSLTEPHIADSVEGRIRRCTPEGIAACQSAMAARPDSTPLLASLNVPCLVVAGDRDAIVSLEEARGMTEALPQAELAVLPGSGHLPNLEDPFAFNDLVTGFLRSVAPPA